MGWAALVFAATVAGRAFAIDAEATPTGQAITPRAAQGGLFQTLNPDLPQFPDHAAGSASALAASPDGKTLLILTSGYNLMFGADGKPIPDASMEYVFVYDVSGPAPVKRQVIRLPNSFLGLVWAPSGQRFYVSGGVDDDVLEYAAAGGSYSLARTFALGHKAGLGLAVRPEAGELAISPDGTRLLVANFQNDSVSVIDLASGKVSEQDLRPGAIDAASRGQPGGSFPRAVLWVADDKAYVTSERDREIIALRIAGDRVAITRRLRTRGQPVALTRNRTGSRLYAATDDTDGLVVIDTATDRVIERASTLAPPMVRPPSARGLGGAGSNGLALAPDGRTLLVTNGAQNDVAIVHLSAAAAGVAGASPTPDADGDGDDDDGAPASRDRSSVIGLIPTGWYPTAVAMAADGSRIFVVNGKSNTGPVSDACRVNLSIAPDHDNACKATNEYVWQKQLAGFLSLPTPSAAELGRLTRQAAENNRYLAAPDAAEAATFAFLRQHIHHVIYVIKENRTYDQVLGDLEVGNGDPRLAVFPRAMTPNQHALARQFVDLDAFFDSGESSNTGWNWSTAARTNDFTEREAPVNYGDRGLQYDQEGDNRQINVGYATSAERVAANPLSPADPDVLPGANDVAAPDGPDGAAGQGYLWDAALRAGLSVRNYGFYGDLSRYRAGPGQILLEREPYKTGHKVFYVAKAALMPLTDPYFWGFNQALPDYWRYKEWEREFDGYVARGDLPSLTLLRLPHDHTGSFAEAVDGVNTVEAELADNDYALGLVVQTLAHSRYAADTLIFVLEDDAQDGPDHVDAHRSLGFVIGPYVRRGAVVSRRYTTVNMLKTMEAVLGLGPMGLNDALAEPMGAVFDTRQADWTYQARVPPVLRSTALPLPPPTTAEAGCPIAPARSAAWWAKAMAGQDFSMEDHLDTAAYNRALWLGLKGAAAFPSVRDGRDLKTRRAALLAAAKLSTCGA
jgi:DNA-binding beta-propeller fold protein YncE